MYNHDTYYCTSISQKLAVLIENNNYDHIKKKLPVFNDKEITIINLLCKEYTNKEIAVKLKLSKRTIEDYRKKLIEKIDAKNSAGIIVFAIKNNIYHP